jgi:hypothetical protein
VAHHGDTHADDRGWGSTVTVAPGTYTATRRLPYLPKGDADGGWVDDGYDDVTYVRGGFERVSPRELPPPVRFRSPVREFVDKYGWRAYALPILVVLTVVALATAQEPAGRRPASAASRPTTSVPTSAVPAPPSTNVAQSSSASTPVAEPNTPVAEPKLKPAALPPGAPYTLAGKGTFRVLPGTTKPVGSGELYRYDIEVENGVTGVDLAEFQHLVDSTLDDPRSWSGHGVQLQRVASANEARFHITLTSAMTVRNLCGYELPAETSCYEPTNARVVLNVARYVRGATAYLGHLDEYRVYMINHEDGHALGHQHAHSCLTDGMAPVMMQQTFGIRSATTRKMCTPNVWPYPPGVRDAPGAEEYDTTANNEYYIAD